MTPPTLLHLVLYAVSAAVLLLTVVSIRLLVVLREHHSDARPRPSRSAAEPAHLAVLLGSGGHTAEMMRLVAHLDWTRFSRRTWIISSGDQLSETKALELEREIGSGQFRILWIPRARKVHQSYLTSPLTTLYSLASCLWHITILPWFCSRSSQGGGGRGKRRRTFADLILLNGPGSCVPIAIAAFLPKLVFLPAPSQVYVESLARTRRLSLSAKLVRPFVDRFFVQWESLRDALIRAESKDQAKRGARLRAKVEYQGWLV
ncbi:hypothetical protein JCM10212_002775 [Sporobolomyces blumeae]